MHPTKQLTYSGGRALLWALSPRDQHGPVAAKAITVGKDRSPEDKLLSTTT